MTLEKLYAKVLVILIKYKKEYVVKHGVLIIKTNLCMQVFEEINRLCTANDCWYNIVASDDKIALFINKNKKI